jgi:hypothetical protein
MTHREALEADRMGDNKQTIARAAELYEQAIASGDMVLDTLINLAVLYWQITDYGFWSALDLDGDLVTRAGSRTNEILTLAQQRFPDAPEHRFWSKYIAWIDLGEDFEVSECRRLLADFPGYLEPAIYLFPATQRREGREQVLALLEQCSGENTCRVRYVRAVAESGLKQAAWDS